jgi:hypothetical protein
MTPFTTSAMNSGGARTPPKGLVTDGENLLLAHHLRLVMHAAGGEQLGLRVADMASSDELHHVLDLLRGLTLLLLRGERSLLSESLNTVQAILDSVIAAFVSACASPEDLTSASICSIRGFSSDSQVEARSVTSV